MPTDDDLERIDYGSISDSEFALRKSQVFASIRRKARRERVASEVQSVKDDEKIHGKQADDD